LGTQVQHDTPFMEQIADTVTVTDPQHPLYGHTFPLLTVRVNRSKTHVTVLLPSGRRRSISRTAITVAPPILNSTTDSPLPVLSVRTMLPLARFIQGLKQLQEEHHATDDIAGDAAPASRVSSITTAVAAPLADPSAPARSSGRHVDPTHAQRRGGKGARA
jgi:hypothetical protein